MREDCFFRCSLMTANTNFGIANHSCLVKELENIRMHPIVAVHEADPLAVAVGKGPVDAGIPGSRQSPILLMNDIHANILLRIFITDRTAFVRTAVIHEDQFEVRKRLRKDAVNAAADIWLYIVYGDDNRD